MTLSGAMLIGDMIALSNVLEPQPYLALPLVAQPLYFAVLVLADGKHSVSLRGIGNC
jgi:hypothetical protein